MPAKLISGTEIAKKIREELKQEVEDLKTKHNVVPGLVTILVGENPASVSYVTAKQKTAQIGFTSFHHDCRPTFRNGPPRARRRINTRPTHPRDSRAVAVAQARQRNKVLYAIDPDKDVDGFHPVNVGKLVIGEAVFLPCTPAGIQQLLIRSGVKTSGAEVVVVGRSNIVGKPIANMMIQKQEGANSTVTVCHTRTKNMKQHTLRGDILIVAAGVPKAVTADMVKDGAVVIDVGVNRIGKTESGKAILCGDVDFDPVKEKATHDHAGSGWCGPHDHHHADDEHREGCEAGEWPTEIDKAKGER